jgi:2-keto-myo-inositol isomerase
MPQSLERDIADASAAGFEGVELWWDKVQAYLRDHTPADLKALLAAHKVVPVSICPLLIWPFRDIEPARASYRAAVELAPQIGCELVIACPDFRPARLTRDEALARHAVELRDLAGVAAGHGVRLAIEPIGRHTLCAGANDALQMIERAGSPDNVGVLLDTFHYFRSQVTDEELSGIPIDKLFIIHVNDTEDGAIDELKDANRVYPLEGVIPLVQMLSRVVDRGYDGYLSVEIFRPEYWAQPGAEVAARSMQSVRNLITLL